MPRRLTAKPIPPEAWRLALENRGLVHHWIARFKIPRQLREDAEQTCMEALALAASRWDPQRGTLSTFSAFYLRRTLLALVGDETAHDTCNAKRGRRDPFHRVPLDDSSRAGDDEHPDFFALAWMRSEIFELPPDERDVMLRVHLQGIDRHAHADDRGLSDAEVSTVEARAIEALARARRRR